MTFPIRTVKAEQIGRFITALLTFHRTRVDEATIVSQALVKASLLGHESHGVLRIGRYIDKIIRGTLDPRGQPSIQRCHGSTAVVDGALGFGQIAAQFGAKLAVGLAQNHGIGAVALSRTNHVGRLGDYAECIANAGCIALIFASGAGPGGSVAAHGGSERIFGTNPLAWGLPVPAGRAPLIADFATSVIPEGKIGMAQARAESLPTGALIDAAGRPTNDPAAFYAGGALLPFGGHKGYSLVLLGEIMANLLAGHVPASSPEYQPGNPAVLIALNVSAFTEPTDYFRHTEALLQRIEASRPAEGFSRVLLPNSLEIQTKAERERTGIPIPDGLWSELQSLGEAAGVPWPA